jgi:hypothetical protein
MMDQMVKIHLALSELNENGLAEWVQ